MEELVEVRAGGQNGRVLGRKVVGDLRHARRSRVALFTLGWDRSVRVLTISSNAYFLVVIIFHRQTETLSSHYLRKVLERSPEQDDFRRPRALNLVITVTYLSCLRKFQ